MSVLLKCSWSSALLHNSQGQRIKGLLINQLWPEDVLFPAAKIKQIKKPEQMVGFLSAMIATQIKRLQPQPSIDQHLAIAPLLIFSDTETTVESLTEVVYFDVWPDCVDGRRLTGVLVCLGN